MNKKYVGDISEELIISQLIKISESEEQKRLSAIARLDGRILEIQEQLRSEEWREPTKRKFRVWLYDFMTRRKELKFSRIGTFVLIKPLAKKYFTQKQTVLDDAANEGKDPLIDDMTTKVIETKVLMAQQLAKVVSIGTLDPKLTPYKAGDTVVYVPGSDKAFDLIKGTSIVYSHNILGIWNA